MINLDTNVVVRFLVADDPEQSAVARDCFARFTTRDPGHISLVTIAECFWVLRRSYRIEASRCVETIDLLTDSPTVVVQQVAEVRRALDRARSGADFADALIAELGRAAGCAETLTFDRRAAERAGMSLIT